MKSTLGKSNELDKDPGIAFYLHDKKIGRVFIVSAIFVGLGRVLGNVHYLLDIIGGSILGVATAYMVEKLHLHKLLG